MTSRNYLLFGLLSSLVISVATEAQGASPVDDPVEHFARIDRDGNQGLSQAEIGRSAWGRYDADEDGIVSQAEFVAGRNADRTRAAAAGRTERAWSLLDWTHDDFLSGTELDGKWERYDADGNGRVTRQEFLGGDAPITTPDSEPVPNDNVDAEPAGKSLWGKSLGEAKKSDLFKFFSLEPLEGTVVLEAGDRFDFRPKAPAFRDLVLVQVLVDRNERIINGAELMLARSFIEHPQNGRFARDMAKSFLAQLTPAADFKQVADLVNEIQFGGGGSRIVLDGAKIPQLPNPPTPGYETFLGKREHFENKFKVSQYSFWNVDNDDGKLLIISIAPKQTEEPGF